MAWVSVPVSVVNVLTDFKLFNIVIILLNAFQYDEIVVLERQVSETVRMVNPG